MILAVLLLLFIICLWGIRFTKINPDYISLEGTKAIKGVFAIIILCSHMRGYLTLSYYGVKHSPTIFIPASINFHSYIPECSLVLQIY